MMKPLAVNTLAEIIDGELTTDCDADVTSVAIDSRSVTAGDCFFAIKGVNFNGHDFVKDAFDLGAVCAVVEKEVNDAAGVCLKVDNTIAALGRVAGWYRNQVGFKVVGITGSVGKTTTREIIAHVLGRYVRCHQSPRSYNNNIGLPLTLLSAPDDAEVVVAELGSNHPGEILGLTAIAKPNIAVVTNVSPAHLEGFGSLENIIKEKVSIRQGLIQSGTFFINADCKPVIEYCKNHKLACTTFGTNPSCDIRADNIVFDDLSSRFDIDGVHVELPLPGRGNVENALAAWAVCRQLGISIDDFVEDIKTVTAFEMRLQLIEIGDYKIINDCYNANPASMKNALDILSRIALSLNRRAVFICGEMAELADHSEDFHRQLGEDIAKAHVDVLLAVGGLAEVTAHTAKSRSQDKIDINCFANTQQLCNNLGNLIKDYDIILIKGSRVAGLENAVDQIKQLAAARTK